MGAAAALSAVSCQLSDIPPKANPATPVVRDHWVKVTARPPTYYPRGVPADTSTDHWSGEWVDTGDDLGTRYFIPLHGLGGVDRRSLVQEALAARSDKKLAQIAAEDREIRDTQMIQTVVFGPLAVAGLTLAAIGGGQITGDDLDRWNSEWYSSKGIER